MNYDDLIDVQKHFCDALAILRDEDQKAEEFTNIKDETQIRYKEDRRLTLQALESLELAEKMAI